MGQVAHQSTLPTDMPDAPPLLLLNCAVRQLHARACLGHLLLLVALARARSAERRAWKKMPLEPTGACSHKCAYGVVNTLFHSNSMSVRQTKGSLAVIGPWFEPPHPPWPLPLCFPPRIACPATLALAHHGICSKIVFTGLAGGKPCRLLQEAFPLHELFCHSSHLPCHPFLHCFRNLSPSGEEERDGQGPVHSEEHPWPHQEAQPPCQTGEKGASETFTKAQMSRHQRLATSTAAARDLWKLTTNRHGSRG